MQLAHSSAIDAVISQRASLYIQSLHGQVSEIATKADRLMSAIGQSTPATISNNLVQISVMSSSLQSVASQSAHLARVAQYLVTVEKHLPIDVLGRLRANIDDLHNNVINAQKEISRLHDLENRERALLASATMIGMPSNVSLVGAPLPANAHVATVQPTDSTRFSSSLVPSLSRSSAAASTTDSTVNSIKESIISQKPIEIQQVNMQSVAELKGNIDTIASGRLSTSHATPLSSASINSTLLSQVQVSNRQFSTTTESHKPIQFSAMQNAQHSIFSQGPELAHYRQIGAGLWRDGHFIVRGPGTPSPSTSLSISQRLYNLGCLHRRIRQAMYQVKTRGSFIQLFSRNLRNF